MSKTIEQFLFEYEDPRGKLDMSSTDDHGMGSSQNSSASFGSMKTDLGSRSRMMNILTGNEPFEYDLLDNPSMVRALVDQVKQMIKNKDSLNQENKSVNDRIKELKKLSYPTREERDELERLSQKNKAYQLQKTLMRFNKKIDELDSILNRMEDGVDLQDKTIKKYDDMVGEIEDAIFQETYVRKNLAYEKGEASGNMKKPTATENFPVRFIAENGKVYFGIVRPPSGIITWEGREAREAWLSDPRVNDIISSTGSTKRYRRDDMLKIRISRDDFKVLTKELLNDKLFSMRTPSGKKKLEYRDSDTVKEALRNYILGGEKQVTDYNIMSGEEGRGIKTVNPSLDKQGRPKDLTSIIDSIEFWRFVRGLF